MYCKNPALGGESRLSDFAVGHSRRFLSQDRQRHLHPLACPLVVAMLAGVAGGMTGGQIW
jgi:hypothetical protein